MFRKILTAIIALAVFAFTAAAQSIRVEAPNLVASDEQFNVAFVVDGEDAPSDFQWTPGDDFQLVWGPQKGSSTSISIVNGKRSKSSQTTYTYVLMPRKTGTFTLPPAIATVKGSKIASRAVSIEVASGGRSSRTQQSQPQDGQPTPRAGGEIAADDIFLRLVVSKTSAVVGEGINAVLKLYTRVNVAGFEDAKFPGFNGFWSNATQSPTNIDFNHRENIGGQIYNSAVLRAWTLIPQKQGEIAIEPAEVVCLINVRKPRTGSIFDGFFQDDYRTVRKRVVTPAVPIHVKALPAGAPSSFGGGVGSFRMKAELTRDSLKAHDAASLKITLSGSGNIALLEAPRVNFPPDFEVYDTKTTDGAGSKTFEYPFIPRSHGDFIIGPVEYSYYDAQTGKYVTLRSDEMPLRVLRGQGGAVSSDATVPGAAVIRRDVRDLGSDIRYISTALPVFAVPGAFFIGSGLFWGIIVLLALAALLVFILMRVRAERRADVAGSRSRAAVKLARKRLSAAGGYLANDLYTAFYEELHRTLLGFVSDKLGMDSSDMSHENIQAALKDAGVPEGTAADFTALLEACEYARYAPSSGHEAMDAHYKAALDVMSTIPSSMKKKHKGPSAAALMLILALALPMGARAAAPSADSLWTAGVIAYSEGRWADAAAAWEEIAAAGLASPELYCNLGDARFKSELFAEAILWYERALKLDPSNKDARFNLDLASSMIQDKIDIVPEFFLLGIARKFCWLLPSDAWAVIACIFFAAMLVFLLVFALSKETGARKAGFFTALALALLFVIALSSAVWQKNDFRRADEAIVMKPVAPVKSAPSTADARDLFILHEGTKVQILDSVGEWSNISLSDGRQGWIQASCVEII